MAKTVIHFILLTIALLLAQLIGSKIALWNVAMPIVFIYLILRLPINMHTSWVITIAFFMGLIVDTFSNTAGMNALACTLLAVMRRPVFYLYVLRDDDEQPNPLPGSDTIGVGPYFRYMATLTLAYCTMLFLIQAFTLRNFPLTLMRIGASSVLSMLLLMATDSLLSRKSEERL